VDHLSSERDESARVYRDRFTVTDEEFAVAITNARSIRQALLSLGMKAKGGAYGVARNRIAKLGLDTTHLGGRNWSAGIKMGERYPIQTYLALDGLSIATSWLRQRLINEGLKEAKCEECDITEWRGQPAPLHLDHINGMRNDNRLENLCILCANCHSLTETYGKTKEYLEHGPKPKKIVVRKRRRGNGTKPTSEPKCRVRERVKSQCGCGNRKAYEAKTCRECYESTRRECKIDWPDTQELVVMLDASSYLEVGRRLGVSDNAIRKRLRARR
jgi:hypothetical protein